MKNKNNLSLSDSNNGTITDLAAEAATVTKDDHTTSPDDDLRAGALAALAGITGGGRCEVAYARCPGRLTARDAFGVLFREFDVKSETQHIWKLENGN
ncbi:hypothetical protein SK128_027384, partial [Halocaridina rubra]